MNKKFLSAILFGALMVTSTGTFVSCKDYDDDIDSLNEKLDKLAKDLSDLQTQAGTYVTAVKYDAATGKLTVTGGNGETFQLPMPAELPTYTLKVQDGKVQLWNGNTLVSEASLPAAATSFDPALLKWKDGYLYYGDEKIAGVEKPQSVGSISEVKDESGEVIAYVIELDGKSARFSLVADLKALVFEPELYYEGIEAIAVKSFVYNALTAKEVSADADNKDDAPTAATTTTEVTPELSATYHMNPSTADVRNLTKEDLTFLAYDKEYARAADGVVVPEISKIEPKDGKLTVWAKLTEGTIKDIAADKKVTVLALQADYLNGDNKRSVITSDYAAVKAIKITDLVLNNAKVAGESHLVTTAAAAIDKDHAPEVKVAWNETVDLAEYVQTHYGKADDTHKVWDENAASGTVEKAGFSYSYELVGYIDGNNKTSQSAHAALNGSVLRPQLPTDGKAAEWGATEQNQATVGRMPLVRVFLNDNNSKKKVAVGYLKVEITGAPAEDRITATTEYTFNEEFTLSCRTEDWVQNVTWFQIEEQILAQLNISKEDFERSYIYDGPMIQYSEATLAAMPLTKLSTKVEQTKTDINGTMTEVLKWTIPANYAYEYFSANASMKAIVRYTKENKDANNAVISNDYVYVTLTWTPNPRNVNPTGVLADANKIQKYWFAANSNEAGSGYNEIHVNAEVPAESGHDIMNFNKVILETFNNDKVVISEINAVYKDFADAKLTKNFRFVDPKGAEMTGVSGEVYTLTVNTDRTQLIAISRAKANFVIATITANADGKEVIALEENDAAKDLLNVAGRDELAKNLTARVVVETVNGCDKSLHAVENDQFDVKFLRPITVKAADMDSFKDGVDVGAEGSEIAVKLAFTDWRNYEFKTTPINYYTYYDVKSISIDTDKAQTTVNGQYEAMPTGMKVEYSGTTTEEIAKGNFGTLTYINNKAEVGEFDIKLPVIVEYAWGTVEFDIVCHVAKTVK